MMMHPVLRAVGPTGALLLLIVGMPAQAGAQQVSLESLMATADSGLAAARAGVATAGLKLALDEKEEARVQAAPTPTPTAAPVPEAPTPTDTGESGAALSPEASTEVSPEDSAATAASSDRLNTLLPAPVLAQAIAAAETAEDQRDAPTRALPGEAAPTLTVVEDPATGGAPEPAPMGTPDATAADLPLTDLVGTTLENGLAGAASITADWSTLFRNIVERHPGLMPALLLLMAAAGATALAVGAGIRPGRRRPVAVGPEGDPSAPQRPRQLRMRPDQRVPRDVAAVLASLEGRRGSSPLYGRDPRDGTPDRRAG